MIYSQYSMTRANLTVKLGREACPRIGQSSLLEQQTLAMDRLTGEQLKRNLAGRDRWSVFAPHRQQIMQRLLAARRGGSDRICVLGAGNANDLDLAALTSAFSEVHLVDLDGDALRFGCDRQLLLADRSPTLHAGVDVTGLWSEMAAWTPQAGPSPERLTALLENLVDSPAPPLAETFDVVASTCLLSQIIEGAAIGLGAAHPRLVELILALRTAHVRMLSRLLVPGGRGLLIADFVSSDSAPELRDNSVNVKDWTPWMERLVGQGNFFHGLNPRVLESLCKTDVQLASVVRGARRTGVWRWDLGNRAYLVCAIEFERAAG